MGFSDINDFNMKLENAKIDFYYTINNLMFYKQWEEFQKETNIVLKNYQKILSLIRPFKIKKIFDIQSVK